MQSFFPLNVLLLKSLRLSILCRPSRQATAADHIFFKPVASDDFATTSFSESELYSFNFSIPRIITFTVVFRGILISYVIIIKGKQNLNKKFLIINYVVYTPVSKQNCSLN